MNLATTVALISSVVCSYVALLSFRFSRAPGWRDQRFFSQVALTAAIYCLCDAGFTIRLPYGLLTVAWQLQMVALLLHGAAWLRYSAANIGQEASVADRLNITALLAGAALSLVPGVNYTGQVMPHAFAPLGVTYDDANVTFVGSAFIFLTFATMIRVLVRLARARGRSPFHSLVQTLGLLVFLGAATNDALVVLEVIHGPYLLDLGILVPIAGVGYALTARFVEAALGLESMVAVRTEELSKTQAALLRAEKLGALGQLAAGVAHEVNNPAAALAGNLRYLREAVAAGGKLPGDGLTCLDESLTSVDRIAGVVRQLLDAGRLATASKAEAAPVSLAKAARDAVRTARARCGDRVAISLDVAEDLWGKGQEHPLVQVLTNLVVNAAQAIAPERTDGQVTVRGQRAGGQVLLVVEDNGAGMSDETQRRLFEPFFTTKAFGQGSGLGLAVSRGLMMALGGDLRFSSRLGGGTRATAELCAAEPSPSAAPPAVAAAPAKPSRGLLIIDDDDEVRDALQRCLGLRYQVSAANGVTAALALLEQGDPWDLILCDLMMPDGGGARVYETLKARSPADAARLVFVTGGATTQEARSYLATNPQPVLQKPVELEVLDKLVESFAVARKAPAP